MQSEHMSAGSQLQSCGEHLMRCKVLDQFVCVRTWSITFGTVFYPYSGEWTAADKHRECEYWNMPPIHQAMVRLNLVLEWTCAHYTTVIFFTCVCVGAVTSHLLRKYSRHSSFHDCLFSLPVSISWLWCQTGCEKKAPPARRRPKGEKGAAVQCEVLQDMTRLKHRIYLNDFERYEHLLLYPVSEFVPVCRQSGSNSVPFLLPGSIVLLTWTDSWIFIQVIRENDQALFQLLSWFIKLRFLIKQTNNLSVLS